ncbi:hypothetical protein DERP_002176 [Dermatophagoides pteronyssinus]|uniref:Uncharacterized protein n=1 Tax=Dermatophagoides pteronyssinus TaxID=6956 RepID=A0ABQ8JHS9_DERPT|nr:hypothetical protein DERP_002176 [Dermatophagoides pteronyssinus]
MVKTREYYDCINLNVQYSMKLSRTFVHIGQINIEFLLITKQWLQTPGLHNITILFDAKLYARTDICEMNRFFFFSYI